MGITLRWNCGIPRSLTAALAVLAAVPLTLPAQSVLEERLANSQYEQLDANPTLFAVLAAINAAGYDADLDSPTNHPMRQAVREYVEAQTPESLNRLRQFYTDHRQRSAAAELNQYVSFALLSAGAPDFAPARAGFTLPPDAAALEDLSGILSDFYQEANLASAFSQALPYYEQEMARYTDPVSESVYQVSAYLRHPLRDPAGRRFQVFVSLLAAPNQVVTRNYLDDYYVVVTPSPEPRIDEIRHAYLHFIVDPFAVRHREDVARLNGLSEYALDSPILPDQYRVDFNLLATECFIKAVEAKVTKRPQDVERAMREGYVLTAAFADQLEVYEQQQLGMENYFADMVKLIDLPTEARRINQIDFAAEAEVQTVEVTRVVAPPAATGIEKTLEEAEQAYNARDLETAKADYNRVFTETQQRSMHARAYYGLARIAILENDPATGEDLFRRVLEFEPDDSTKSWSLLYLGKLSDALGERDPANQYYRDALAVPEISDQVRREAQQGLDGAFARPGRQ